MLAAFLANALEPAQQASRQGQLEEGVRHFLDGVGGPGTFDQITPSGLARGMENAPELRALLLAPPATAYPVVTCEELGQVSVPTLLQTGELSPRFLHRITDELERCLAHAERVILSGVSHGLRANPDAYNASVLAFLARHAAEL